MMGQAHNLETARSIAELRAVEAGWRKAGLSIGLVPTMGGLHEGHIALVRRALAVCERVVVTIFVNPRQFGSADDLARYPRREDEDREKLAAAGAHLVFIPPVAEMYPDGAATIVSVAGPLTETLDAVHRPGHFDGVATIVAKLFLQSLPDVAFFGEKDFQQLQIVTRMARDLDIPVRIEPVATVRDADGLALSSRNLNLSPDERRVAAAFPAALFAAAEQIVRGGDIAATLGEARRAILRAGFDKVDYIELADAETLHPVHALGPGPARLFGAAWVGPTRLIDNLPLASS
ncbi:MAG TPA: pantoate--beta-alanine ligase [Stellaceae bacterium]|jgi:pantoate--beta-alanine ligase|nr:pantoate--beta-alanine ligase [Stellaceae bacterium]